MRLREKENRKPPSIPTASMGDVAFLIIIFFITSTVFSKDRGLKLILPEKSTVVAKIKKENILTIKINAIGEVMVDKEIFTDLKMIRSRVEDGLANNDSLVISIKTHPEARYERMIQVLDQVRLAGAKRISLVPIKTGG
ncbi:biopolymer transporter ExbD [candidate division WOR-3 bacterium]|uniref:Biopolymer transporter ExbD n=1 Tax=candidate division WOR-3 bacterium TaxID=2052148 RepID=A0A660SI43_UNCW3|nr:MAG: biopolymer transporter ExbD [candidate division WOR-3 bacterium]